MKRPSQEGRESTDAEKRKGWRECEGALRQLEMIWRRCVLGTRALSWLEPGLSGNLKTMPTALFLVKCLVENV